MSSNADAIVAEVAAIEAIVAIAAAVAADNPDLEPTWQKSP